MKSNLEVFLDAATPQLRWRSVSMECFEGPNNVWQLDKKDVIDYFTLQDLWGHYSESSVYGLGVPVRLETGKIVTQHFAPYLSAIQIYTTKALAISRLVIETFPCVLPTHNFGQLLESLEIDCFPGHRVKTHRSMGSETDSCSDDSMGEKFSRSWDAVSDYSNHEDSDSISAKQSGVLSFQYSEWNSPYERVPLADKVAELAQDYPCLTSLKSAELSPSSWMSVAWYPIYHIPAHGNLKGISACFLTYHSISSVFQDNIQSGAESDGSDKIAALSPFGLATYRMDGNLWSWPGSSDPKRISDLFWAASSWLKQVRAHHPDFNFFTSSRSP